MNKSTTNDKFNNINKSSYIGSHTSKNQNEQTIEYTLTSTYCSINFQKKCTSNSLNCKLLCVTEIRKVKCVNGGTINYSNIKGREYIIDCDFCKIIIKLDMSKIGQSDVYDIVSALNDKEAERNN
uniref:Uncharacterized protein n=1 Tax=Mimivirus LCMiAC02 TaxID=2506609 RepID=A0A4D5XEX8_9VIRU|nr:MAG: hypothetical protein LCMiAC02_03990 [Mimivirus LCMiAC02]